jgi:PAS domain-containing protein
LKLHNDLKTEKIAELQKQFRSTLEEIKQACFVVSGDLKVAYVNKAAMDLFSLDDSVAGKSIAVIAPLWKLIEEPLKANENERRIEINTRIKRADIRKRCITVLSFRSKADVPPSMLIIIK